MCVFPRVFIQGRFEPVQGSAGDFVCLGHKRDHLVAALFTERLVHASGNYPGRMDPLAGKQLDDLLTDFAKLDAVERQGLVGVHYPYDVPLGRFTIHSEHEVGRGEMKEAQSMRLYVRGAA